MAEITRTLTEKEFCNAVGISRTTAWRERKAGRLPHCRLGGKVVYLPKHADQYLTQFERNICTEEVTDERN